MDLGIGSVKHLHGNGDRLSGCEGVSVFAFMVSASFFQVTSTKRRRKRKSSGRCGVTPGPVQNQRCQTQLDKPVKPVRDGGMVMQIGIPSAAEEDRKHRNRNGDEGKKTRDRF
ncbi:hypothetical protein BO71DRAFT_487495 [Aspergillus ellipticus CBS 707.79]|uniref:Uncharacterized protein n=1 Tax=Aspergillus ellipticus CBS 707.79 TaxID=1448320 RepID=A0A319CXG5_9EURO|nr:hypothetical protein BO71DRAFT_487495 [Aspergillus ellipticus CBS 707.79]